MSRLAALFYALRQLNNSPEWQEVAVDFSTRLQAHADAMRTHSGLAERVERESGDWLILRRTADSYPRLVRETWRNLQRAGAELNDADQQRLGEVNRELTELAAVSRTTWFAKPSASSTMSPNRNCCATCLKTWSGKTAAQCARPGSSRGLVVHPAQPQPVSGAAPQPGS